MGTLFQKRLEAVGRLCEQEQTRNPFASVASGKTHRAPEAVIYALPLVDNYRSQ
jgi:hypothetical protein